MNPLAPARPWYRWELLALLFLAFFFHQGDRAIYGVVLSAIRSELALTDGDLGLVGSVLFATLALAMPLAGWLGDLWDRKRVIVGSVLFWSIATMCTGLSSGLWGLIAFRSVATAGGESFYAPAAYPLLAAHHVRTRAIALSIHQSALYIGVMTSGILGGWIAGQWGWRAAFYVFGGGGILLGAVLAWRLRAAPAPLRRGVDPDATFTSALGVLFRSPTALLLTVGFTAIVFVNNAYVVWAPAFMQERCGLPLMEAGGHAMVWHHAAALAGILCGGWLSDRLAAHRPAFRLELMAAAMFAGVPAIIAMGRAEGLAGLATAMAVFGCCRGLYEANTHAALFEVIAPRHRAAAVGVMTMGAFLVGAVSPWLLGHLRGTLPAGQGLATGFTLLAGAYAIGGVAVLCARCLTFPRDRCDEAACSQPVACH